MNRTAIACLVSAATLLLPAAARADDQEVADQCIVAWGSASPFKKGTPPHKIIKPGVKVFSLGKSNNGDETITSRPSLILIRPAVNVFGKTTIRLANPKGWYCFKSNVTVAGKLAIEAHCKAHIANARDDGTSVLAQDESDKGVAVMGALRVTRFGCEEKGR